MGWDISRSSLAKIEAQLVHVSDSDLLYFVRLFEVEPIALYPDLDPTAQWDDIGFSHNIQFS